MALTGPSQFALPSDGLSGWTMGHRMPRSWVGIPFCVFLDLEDRRAAGLAWVSPKDLT